MVAGYAASAGRLARVELLARATRRNATDASNVRSGVEASYLIRVAGAVLLLGLIALLAPRPVSAAVSSLAVDVTSGRTVHALDADRQRYPASLAKMMTLYLLFDAIDSGKLSLNSRLRVSRRAAAQPPTKLGLLPGRTIMVRDAILALATQSANDVAVVVAEALAGSEGAFAARMTAKARGLGMRRTTFRNASGLHHTQQKTTARDMALLGRALLRDFPRRYAIFATRSFRYGGARYGNHNRLLGVYQGMDGIKTGYTDEAGFNLVASAKREDRRILGVVMGAPSSAERNALMVQLLDEGFRDVPRAYASMPAERVRKIAERSSTRRTVATRSRSAKAIPSLAAKPRVAEAGRKAAASPRRLKAKARAPEIAHTTPRLTIIQASKVRPSKARVVVGSR
jgi:D-alanyl-D-alanine carboxypeptidase